MLKLTTVSEARTTITNQQGNCEFQGLPPGTYTLAASAGGFALFVKENVEVLRGRVQRADV
jgi:hypothetical protein